MLSVSFNSYQVMCVQILYFVVLFGKKRIKLFKPQIWRADINMRI